MKNNFWKKLDKPIIGLAPLAGYTDSPTRQIQKKHGAEIVYSEMISSHGLVYRDKKSFNLAKFRKIERPIIIQLFGREPSIMASAAEIVEKEIRADGVDINFGCPAKRVISSGHGVALMDEPKLAQKISKKVSASVKIPLSVKCRLGLKNKKEIFDFAKRMEDAGISALTIHGRTLKQGFSGQADWWPIYEVKKMLKNVIILGNGDVFFKKDLALRLSEGKIDGVLIGRGALGNPFIFEGAKVIKRNPQKYLKGKGFIEPNINMKEKARIAVEHAELAYKEKGERGIIEMRKQIGLYLKGENEAKKLRTELVRVESVDDVVKIFQKYHIL